MVAIEIVGTGRRARYILKKPATNRDELGRLYVTGFNPVDGKPYETAEAAREAAAALGLDVIGCGDFWEINHAARTALER